MKIAGILSSSLMAFALTSANAADAMKPAMPGVGTGQAFPQTEGADIYEAACQACHMPGGVGATAAASYPALAKNPRLKAKAYPIIRVLKGSRAMPPFADVLTDDQIVAVVSYIRTHFGNSYRDKVTVADVKALHP